MPLRGTLSLRCTQRWPLLFCPAIILIAFNVRLFMAAEDSAATAVTNGDGKKDLKHHPLAP